MIYDITPREKQIIVLISNEYSSKEIAKFLYISFETVKTHRRNLLQKLRVKNVAGMVRVAFEQGIINTH